jgi:starch-binding outer membrane protein, SusD/RagB family
MKNIKYSIIFILGLFSCQDVLDRSPLDKISQDQVWNNEVMVQAYITNLYSRFPFFAFEPNNWYSWTDEGTQSTGNSNNVTRGLVSKSSEMHAYWDYGYIRDLNIFLENIVTAGIPEALKKQLEGEVRFIRAYAYFEKMKRYGGVPLVDIVIDPFGEIPDKYVVRAKEEEIAEFIDSELAKAIALLPEAATPRGRVNKWAAYALQARSNLWAASIAKFGTVQLEGIVGIPASKANAYYQKASAAATNVINSGKFSLYNANPNKEENYRRLFVENNNELIFVKPYDGVNIGHSWDEWHGPNQTARRGGQGNPMLELLLRYENVDGSDDQPAFGAENLYNNGREPFAKKDPRLFASVFFQGDSWSGITVQTYEGLDPSASPTPSAINRNSNDSYQGVPVIGADSRSLAKDDFSTNSGFHIKKYLDHTGTLIDAGNSKTNWIVFRLAEMYLIKAEAEFEQGNLPAAVAALNMTRDRAGITLVDENTITRERVRIERSSELAFETHRYWDLRRWRTAVSVLNNRFKGLQIILHHATGKYYFLPFDCESFTRVFKEEHYYNPITDGRLNNNPKLIENPLY